MMKIKNSSQKLRTHVTHIEPIFGLVLFWKAKYRLSWSNVLFDITRKTPLSTFLKEVCYSFITLDVDLRSNHLQRSFTVNSFDPIINSLMNKAYNFHKVHDEKIYVHVTSRIKKRSIDEL